MKELFEFANNLFALGPNVLLGASVTGCVGLAGLAGYLRHVARRSAAELEKRLVAQEARRGQIETQLQEVQEQNCALHSRLHEKDARIQEFTKLLEEERQRQLQLQEEVGGLKEEVRTLGETADRLRRRRNEWRELARSAQEQIRAITSSDGRVWEQPVGPCVAFRPARNRRARIVSVLNFKGGVGKTMLVGNLAAWLAQERGCRTLVIDLDYQMNLTQWCLTHAQLAAVREEQRWIHVLFQQGGGEQVPSDLTSPTCVENLHLIAASNLLVDDEMKALAVWLARESQQDVRFLLRKFLHASPSASDVYDWILLDCPPRLTTATINAICASDYFLVPVVLDQVSVLAVPELLRLIREYKRRGVCPDIALKGVVANQTSRLKMARREQTMWRELATRCQHEWGEVVRMFARNVPGQVRVRDRMPGRFASLTKECGPIFRDLAEELVGPVPLPSGAHP